MYMVKIQKFYNNNNDDNLRMRMPTSQSGLQKGPQKNTKLHQKLAKQ